MTDRLSELEARLGQMAEYVHQLERRIGALEQRPAGAAAPARRAPDARAVRSRDASAAAMSKDLAALSGNLALAPKRTC